MFYENSITLTKDIMKQKLLKTLVLLCALIVGISNVWATSYISYNGDTQDTSTTISSLNVSSGSAGVISWTGQSCTYSSSRVNIAANGSITFTALEGYNITKIVIVSGSTSTYYGTWTSSPSVSPKSSSGTTTFDGLSANSVTVTTSTAFRCTSASSIKIYYTSSGSTGPVVETGENLTFDFTDDAWGFPESYALTNETYTNDGYTITLGASSDGHKVMTSGGKITALIWGKKNATLALPAFPFNVSKIKVYGNTGASGKVTFNVFVDDAAVSTGVTSSQVDHEFKIADAKQAAGTVYTLKITNANNCQISKIEVFGYVPVTIGSAGFATLFTPAALDFSGVAGLTAYTAAKEGDVVRLTKVDNVPANTGVVLEGTAGTYSIPAIATSSTAKGELTGNATEATAWDAESGITYYVLASASKGSGVEFRPVETGEIAAGKAFLKVAGGKLVHAFNVVFGDETGISEVVRDGEKESAIFDLSGRRVAKPAKGLYIVNGKKILVK